MPPSELTTLAERLAHATTSVRRIGVADLIRLDDPVADAMLLDHLATESDARIVQRVVHRLGAVRFQEARSAMARLRDDPASSAQMAHDALLAHDRIEWAAGEGCRLE